MTALTPIAAINDRLRKSGQRLHVEQVGREIVVHDEIMLGCRFSLPIGTALGQVAMLAIAGTQARRAFIHGGVEISQRIKPWPGCTFKKQTATLTLLPREGERVELRLNLMTERVGRLWGETASIVIRRADFDAAIRQATQE